MRILTTLITAMVERRVSANLREARDLVIARRVTVNSCLEEDPCRQIGEHDEIETLSAAMRERADAWRDNYMSPRGEAP